MDKHYCPYCMAPVRPGESCPNCGLTAGSYMPSLHHLPPGTVLLDRYLVGRVLGEGGFGITYIGCDLRLELKVAIKEYYPVDRSTRNAAATLDVTSFMGLSAQSFERGKQKFLNEARTMARMVKQQVIVSVRDYFEANNTAYIVMEYIEGTTFSHLVEQKGGRIPPAELFETLEPLFGALSIMHDNGLIHRDISPDNLMLENGRVRLLDFGCARETSRGTETLTIALKHGYAPLEQYQQKGQGPWTDIYALCATIYFCLTGKAPPQALDRIAEDMLLLPSKLGVDLPSHQEAALLKGLRIQPGRRFQTVEELRAALYAPAPEGISVPVTRREPIPPEEPAQEEPVPETPEPPEELPEPPEESAEESPVQPRSKLSKKVWAAIGAGAAVLVLILALVLLPKGGETPAPAPSSDLAEVMASAEIPEPSFTVLSSGGEAELRALLADDSVEAVSLQTQVEVSEDALTVNKPLTIQAGAGLNANQPVTITSALRVEGELCVDYGMLRTTEGGTITVGPEGMLHGITLAWLEHWEDLTVEPGGTAQLWNCAYGSTEGQDHFLVLDEEALFAEATHVNSFAEYQDAIHDSGTKSIVIDGDMTITDEDRAHSVPVRISEGVTVTAPPQNFDFAVSGSWCVAQTVLVNYGTIVGAFQTGDWNDDSREDYCAVVNYGTIEAEMHLDCRGVFLNLGDVNVTSAQFIRTNVYNLGRLDHVTGGTETFMDVAGPLLCNWGQMTVAGENVQGDDSWTTLTLANCSWFINCGDFEIGPGGELYNESRVINQGRIAVTDPSGAMNNAGYLDTSASGSTLDFHPDSTLGNGGLIQQGSETTLNLPGNIEEWGDHVAQFSWDDDCTMVNTEAELRAALDSIIPTPDLCIDGVDIAVAGDLTVGRTLAIGSGSLTLQGGNLTVTGADTVLMGSVDLGGGTLTLTDGAVMVAGELQNCGGIHIEGGAKLVQQDWLVLLPEAELTLENGSNFISLNGLELRQVQVSIGAGVLRTCGGLELYGCTVDIGEDGELLISESGIFLDEGTTVTNRGSFALGGWEWQNFELAGTLTSYGRMELHASLKLSGSLTNYGTMKVSADIPVSSLWDNQGTVELYNGAQITEVDGGTVTGTPGVDVGQW